MIKVLSYYRAAIILQYTNVANLYAVYLKLTVLCVRYISEETKARTFWGVGLKDAAESDEYIRNNENTKIKLINTVTWSGYCACPALRTTIDIGVLDLVKPSSVVFLAQCLALLST